ncbi:DUF7669 domain-containing protein [Blastococcus sp. PRF04-17]|uniref:DUF7669 domain-containing protein n=1 Tax=Blastococcus sp. PRF04-17 TaxID=2933797 RepID=UPI001FF35CF7|nr:DUF6884 domain-containing protein [Blastococcus sp. PRF04-17]UOY01920.1 hypothetical protein MVA48_00605 [Blastococcus sp. PRF04-17]
MRLPTIGELVAEGAATLPEPFTRAALINWVSARRPDVGVASISQHIQVATDNASHPSTGRAPLLHRVGRGQYLRYRGPEAETPEVAPDVVAAARVVLIGSSGTGFARARDHAVAEQLPWFVLSAKHGLLDPGDVVAPSRVELADRSAGYRAAWGEWVVAQLADRVQLPGLTVEVHGGVDFAQPLRSPLTRRGAALELALPGAWREPGSPAPHDRTEDGEGSAHPVLHRLRDLVTRHRPQAS